MPTQIAKAFLTALVLLTAACGSSAPEPANQAPPSSGAAGLQIVLVNSVIEVGDQRLAIGVLDHNTPVKDASVHVKASRTINGTSTIKSEGDAPFKSDGLDDLGIYAAHIHFDAPGEWVLEISAHRPSGAQADAVQPVRVVTTSAVPMVGAPAPKSHNLTASDVADVSYIDSGQPPNDMHLFSIATAISQHRPALVVFATPAFCQSATCGPQVHAVQAIEPTFRDRLVFIHVEIYVNFKPDPSKKQLNPIVDEWHLESEPWVFMIDSNGIVRYEFEGLTASDELRAAASAMLAGS